jgi:peptide/nickel transport system ATP-binding protein/oligopeptide transport system ATP-binding protein
MQPLLKVEDLRVAFPIGGALTEAVRGVSFEVAPGEAVGLVGESGSGKSVTALAITRLLAPSARILGGRVMFDGRDLITMPQREIRRVRGKRISIVFQDPLTALNPAFTIGTQLMDTICAHQEVSRRAARSIAIDALALVGITSPESRLGVYPHQFSGGMRQRALIAMAVCCKPELLIADEPTTALDVTVQSQVIGVLERLRRELGLAILFISHNLDLVAEICDRVVVMYAGRVAEEAPVTELFARPMHPYTRLLQRCIPRLGRTGEALVSIDGAPPALGRFVPGCAFAPRCPSAIGQCQHDAPAERGLGRGRVACWVAA